MIIIKIILEVIFFVISLSVWDKAINHIDELLKKKLSKRCYGAFWISVFVILIGWYIYVTIFK